MRHQIATQYPELWQRISARRRYIREELHLHLQEDVLPLSNTLGYLRPYLLNKSCA